MLLVLVRHQGGKAFLAVGIAVFLRFLVIETGWMLELKQQFRKFS